MNSWRKEEERFNAKNSSKQRFTKKKKKVASKVLQEALSSNPSVDMGLSWTGLNRNS